ncbi:MAG: hypothetical protein ACQERL_05745 [Bacillota bacterium]
MRKIIFLFLIILLLGGSLTKAAEITEEDWLQDLNYLEKELPARHKNLFFQLEKEVFKNEIKKIKADLSKLSNLEITLKLAELFTKIGDSHTAVDNTRFFKEYYPVYFKKFADGYRVRAVDKEYKELLGAKLTSINGYSTAELKNKFSALITADNQNALEYKLASFLNLKEVLSYLKIINQKNEFIFNEGDSQLKISFAAKNIENINENANDLIYLDYQKNFVFSNTDQLFWSKYLKTENILYFQYNSCWSRELAEKHKRPNSDLPSFFEQKNKIFNLIENNEIEKFVIDLRYNKGGDSSQGTQFAVELNKYKDEFDTYVIIGPNTFSSAIINALDFKNQLEAYLIGTATMGKPNHFGEVRAFILPNTELKVSYSTKYFKLLENSDPDALYPDITVETEFEDFLNGRDTVLKIITTID